MGEFTEATTVYSNFVTPPDIVTDPKHTVLLVDVDQVTVQKIAMFCQTADAEFNVYMYNTEMGDDNWFFKVTALADAIIVNTDTSELSPVKDRLAEMSKSYYYGPKKFLTNNKVLVSPLQYFQEYQKSD
jgi:hypothetical protein